MSELLAVAAITILAVISPGPDFAMVTRTSYISGPKAGLLTALGIALGVQVHVMYTIFGIALVIEHSPVLFLVMKFAGAAWLIYLGFKSFSNKTTINLDDGTATRTSPLVALRNGFLTNALNPKTMLFVVSSYTQVVRPGSPLLTNLCYGVWMSFAHWAWFSLVAVFFSSGSLRRAMLDHQLTLDKVIGTALMMLGLALAVTGTGH
jgi:threonine/homoserine/homoserine lactone efflux protein